METIRYSECNFAFDADILIEEGYVGFKDIPQSFAVLYPDDTYSVLNISIRSISSDIEKMELTDRKSNTIILRKEDIGFEPVTMARQILFHLIHLQTEPIGMIIIDLKCSKIVFRKHTLKEDAKLSYSICKELLPISKDVFSKFHFEVHLRGEEMYYVGTNYETSFWLRYTPISLYRDYDLEDEMRLFATTDYAIGLDRSDNNFIQLYYGAKSLSGNHWEWTNVISTVTSSSRKLEVQRIFDAILSVVDEGRDIFKCCIDEEGRIVKAV